MRIQSLTFVPTVFRAPSEIKEQNQPLDQVELTQASAARVAVPPVEQAVVAQATGPLGPVLADEISRLPCRFLHKKVFHLPWTDAHRPLSAEQAAEALNRDDGRLRVEFDGQIRPLQGVRDLAVLEQALTGETARPLPAAAQTMAGHHLLDLAKLENLGLYDAYLQVEAHRPVVVFEKGYPLARLNGPEPANLRDYGHFESALENQPAEAAALLVEALGADVGKIEAARLYPLSSPFRRVIERMPEKLDPASLATRLRLLGDEPEHAIRALTPFGLTRFEADLGQLTNARQALSRLDGQDPETFARLDVLARHSANFYARFAEDPKGACLAALPKEQARVNELFATNELNVAVRGVASLAELSKLSHCLDRGSGSLAERLEALTTVRLGRAPEDLYELHMQLIEAGNDQGQAKATMERLLKAEQSPNSDKVRGLVRDHLLAPDKAPARDFYLEQMAVGRDAGYITDTFEPLGRTTLAERVAMAEKLADKLFTRSWLRLALEEVASGRNPEQAADRTLELAQAAEKARRYQSDSDHWRLTVRDPYEFYRKNLLKADREPARKLFLELLADKKEATSVADILAPVKNLSLEQRAGIFDRLQRSPFPRAMYELMTTALEASHPLEQAEAKTSEFTSAAESGRRYQGQSDHWRLTVSPAHAFYRDELLTPSREPARKLFLQLLAEKKDALSVSHVLPEVAGLDLEARIALFGELQLQKYANPMYDLTTAAMATGATLERAKELTRAFSVAGDKGRRYQSDSDHWRLTLHPACQFYQQQLLAPDREPARGLFLRMLAARKDPTAVSHVLPEVSGLSLERRVELFEQLDQARFGSSYYDLLTAAVQAGTELEQAQRLVSDFAEAAEKGRRYQGDSDHWRLTARPAYDFYRDELLTPAREPARALFLKLLAEKKDANSVAHVLPAAGNLDLGARIDLLAELQATNYPIPMYDLIKAGLNQGADLEQAKELARAISVAGQTGRRYSSDSDHWRLTLKPAVDYYSNHLLTPEKAPARDYFLELLAAKKDPVQVDHALGDLPGLDLNQRVTALRELKSPQMYDLFAQAVRSGQPPDRAQTMAEDFAKAAESGRKYPGDADHWRLTVREPYEFYSQHLLGPANEPARQLFLKLLAAKQQPLEIKAAFAEIPNTTLEQRVELFDQFGQSADAAFACLEEGSTLEQARSEAGRVQAMLQSTAPVQNPSRHLRDGLNLYRSSPPLGREVLLLGLAQGQSLNSLQRLVPALQDSLAQASAVGIKREDLQAGLDTASAGEFHDRIQAVLGALILKKSLESDSGGSLEMNEDEIVINDIPVARRDE